MAHLEDLLQLKNRHVEGIESAPVLLEYPEHVDGPFPMTLSWIIETRPDTARVVRTNLFMVALYVSPLGEGSFGQNKALVARLRGQLLDAYEVRSAPDQDEESHTGIVDDAWQQNDPAVRLVPGSFVIRGGNGIISGPDLHPYHGLEMTGQIEEKTNRS